MTRSDRVLAHVSAGMQDRRALCEALEDMLKGAFREGDCGILYDIAHHVAESSNGVTAAYRESHAHRLLDAMERYARAALTAKAEDDIPLDEADDIGDEA